MINLSFFKKYFDVFKAIIVLTAVCLVISAALALTNSITKDRIAEMEVQAANDAMAALVPNCEYVPVDVKGIKGLENAEIHLVVSKGETIGYIFTTSAKGYGGDVKVMTAISVQKEIIGVNILSASDETPGLGQNATKPDFYDQFLGKTAGVGLVKNGANGNQINAVTGATITSRAVTAAVNEAFDQLTIFLEATAVPETEIPDTENPVTEEPEIEIDTEVQYEE